MRQGGEGKGESMRQEGGEGREIEARWGGGREGGTDNLCIPAVFEYKIHISKDLSVYFFHV